MRFSFGSVLVCVCVLCGYLVGQIMCNYRCRSDAYKLFRTKFKLLNTWLSIEFIHWIHQQAKIVGFSVCPLQFLPVLVGSRAAQSIWFGYHVCITTPEWLLHSHSQLNNFFFVRFCFCFAHFSSFRLQLRKKNKNPEHQRVTKYFASDLYLGFDGFVYWTY